MSTLVKSSDDGVLSQASDQASSRDDKLLPPLPGTETPAPPSPQFEGLVLFLLVDSAFTTFLYLYTSLGSTCIYCHCATQVYATNTALEIVYRLSFMLLL